MLRSPQTPSSHISHPFPLRGTLHQLIWPVLNYRVLIEPTKLRLCAITKP